MRDSKALHQPHSKRRFWQKLDKRQGSKMATLPLPINEIDIVVNWNLSQIYSEVFLFDLHDCHLVLVFHELIHSCIFIHYVFIIHVWLRFSRFIRIWSGIHVGFSVKHLMFLWNIWWLKYVKMMDYGVRIV